MNPSHEQAQARLARELRPDLYVSVSSDLAPLLGEYERTATTVMNAHLGPTLRRHVAGAGRAAADGRAPPAVPRDAVDGRRDPRGGGGAAGREHPRLGARRRGRDRLGPGRGARLPQHHRHRRGRHQLRRRPGGRRRAAVGPSPVVEQYPCSCRWSTWSRSARGGGSIAWVEPDDGGSAGGTAQRGLQPGPVCYGRGGTEPTVTDADLVLGRIDPSTSSAAGSASTWRRPSVRSASGWPAAGHERGRGARASSRSSTRTWPTWCASSPSSDGVRSARLRAVRLRRRRAAHVGAYAADIGVRWRWSLPTPRCSPRWASRPRTWATPTSRPSRWSPALLAATLQMSSRRPSAATLRMSAQLPCAATLPISAGDSLCGDPANAVAPGDLARINAIYADLERQAAADLQRAGFGPRRSLLVRSVELRFRRQTNELAIRVPPGLLGRRRSRRCWPTSRLPTSACTAPGPPTRRRASS